MKKISVKTFYLIAVISIGLIGLAVGSTYAMFTTSAEINNPITISSNLTSNNDVMETFEVEIEPYKTVTQTININSDTIYNVNYTVWYLNDVTGIEAGIFSTNTRTTGIINAKELGIGTICNIVLRNNSAEKKTITIGVATSKNDIVLASNMIRVPQRVLGERQINTNAATYIKKLYSTTQKSTVKNNSITYNTSPSQLLMNDRKGSSSTGIDAGNIRYYGASPDNYVYFNCSNYNNPTASTCELWRIIGVFDGKVKIIRNSNIGTYAWDNMNGSGSNDWSKATLMKLLNQGYTGTGGSLYYNSKSGSCYAGQNKATKSCNFTSTGIKNDETRNMISENNWNLGATNGYTYYPNQYYTYERGTSVYTGRPTSWIGKIAPMYLSDYAYASDFNKCNKNLQGYTDTNCTNTNWLKGVSSTAGSIYWTLTPKNSDADGVYDLLPYISSSVSVGSSGAYNSFNVAPTLYLNPDTIITKGEGTKDSPYKVKYDDSGKGEYFNGKTDYKRAGFASYNFGKTITMVSRFKIENYNGGTIDLIGNWEIGGGGLYIYDDGILAFNLYNSSSSNYSEIHTSSGVSLNKWHTAVGTYDGTTMRLYLDGTQVASKTVSFTIKASNAELIIGANPDADGGIEGQYFNGYISDALVIDGALSSSIVQRYYGKTFNRSYNNAYTLIRHSTNDTSYKLSGTSLGYVNDGRQLHLDGKNNAGYSRSSSVKTWYDLSGNKNNGTITGTTWGSNYLSFASSSDHVEKTSATYNISSEYTLEVVLRPIDQVDRYQSIFDTVNTGANIKQYMTLWSSKWNDVYTNSSYRIENSDGTNNKVIYYSGIEKNTTYTLSATLNGKTLKLYKNGSLFSTNNLTITPRMSESGMYISSSSYPFYGYIYSIRVYNRELSASEISANYQNDKSRFGF